MSKPVRIPDQLAAKVEELATLERRPFAAMAALLIEDGIKVRTRQQVRVAHITEEKPLDAHGPALDAEVGKADVKTDFKG